jgi:hypothetical protein
MNYTYFVNFHSSSYILGQYPFQPNYYTIILYMPIIARVSGLSITCFIFSIVLSERWTLHAGYSLHRKEKKLSSPILQFRFPLNRWRPIIKSCAACWLIFRSYLSKWSWNLGYYRYTNKNVDIKISAHDAFL